MLNCEFCRKECKNKNALAQHQIRCRSNPDRIDMSGSNNPHFNKKGSNQWKSGDYIISDETRHKLSIAHKGKTHSQETKEKLSRHAKKNGFGGVAQSRRIKYNDRTLGSSYELKVAISLDENNIQWDTCKRFIYTDPSGKRRTYTPDIYLPEYDVYLDPKNDFLINNINPSLGFSDIEKINLVQDQNFIRIIILDKNQLDWNVIKELL